MKPSGNIAVEAHKHSRRAIMEDKRTRQVAIAKWPLIVARTAQDMLYLLEAQEHCAPDKEVEECLDVMEASIRESFVSFFGVDILDGLYSSNSSG